MHPTREDENMAAKEPPEMFAEVELTSRRTRGITDSQEVSEGRTQRDVAKESP